MENTTVYLDAAELAKLIRADLKVAYPGVKFSVTLSRYSGGSSVRVRWTDGPIAADVDATIALYKAEGFDGMTDSRTNSGPVELADGRRARIHSFIFTNRDTSPALEARVAAWLDRHPVEGEPAYVADRRGWRILSCAQLVAGNLVIKHDGRRY